MLSDVIYMFYVKWCYFCIKTLYIFNFYHLQKLHKDLRYEIITYFIGQYKNLFLHQPHTNISLGDWRKALQNIPLYKLILNQATDISFLVIFYFGLTIAVIFLICPANCCNHHGLVRLFPWENDCSLFFPVEFLEWKHHFTVSNVMCFRGRN